MFNATKVEALRDKKMENISGQGISSNTIWFHKSETLLLMNKRSHTHSFSIVEE
jgi:hypothetical protein